MSQSDYPSKREILRTGTYLHIYCPHCRKDLDEDNWVSLIVERADGKAGALKLSPRFNVFEKRPSIPLEQDVELKDLRCPACEQSLAVLDRRCGRCDSRAAMLHVSVVHLDLDLYVCLRTGCRWHGLSSEDEKRVVLDEAPEA